MIEIQTQKLYYGSPVYLVGYADSTHGYNFSTMSSSYSIIDMLVCGMEKNGGAWSNIQKTQTFSINILPLKSKHLAFYGGQNKKENRFNLHPDVHYHIDETYHVPLIQGSILQFICTVESVSEYVGLETLVNVTAKIQKRFIHEDFIQDGKMKTDTFYPLTFYADEHGKTLK